MKQPHRSFFLLMLWLSVCTAGVSHAAPSITNPETGTTLVNGLPQAATISNRVPVISGTPATSVNVGAAYTFTPSASDADKDKLTFSITNKPAWATFDTATGKLTGIPTTVSSSTGIVISVTDGKSTAVSLPAFNLQVIQPNRAPVISGTPVTSVNIGTAYSFMPTATDADKDKLTFSITNKPAWATFDVATGKLSGTPASTAVGITRNIKISVTDGKSTAVNLPAFDLQVIQPNRAPVISGTPATSVNVGTAYSFIPTATDADKDKLTFSITNKPTWATFDATTGKITGTPTAAGTTTGIVISVTDGKAIAVSLPTFNLQVIQPNRAPVISGTPLTKVNVATAYSFIPTASDADKDKLTFSITNKPAWATFDATTGKLSGTPTAAGITTGIVISVSDGKAAAVNLPAFNLQVIQPNRAPTLTGKPTTSVKVKTLYSFTPTATDADNDKLTFSITNKPAWATFDTTTGKLTGTPTAKGSHRNIIIKVTDTQGSTATLAAFSIEVVDSTLPVAIDTDGDGQADAVDNDDDNDGVLDNDDYKPLDASLKVNPSYNGRVNSYAQTYVRKDTPTQNYNSNAYLLTRNLNGAYATAGLLYFDIPTTLNGKRLDKINKATLTVKSDTEKDKLNVYASTNAAFPAAASANWNNTATLFGTALYAQMQMTPAMASGVDLGREITAGKTVFIVDESGDDSREKLMKSNTETYLDLTFQEVNAEVVTITQVANSVATQAGGELKYQVSLAQAPTQDVYVPFELSDTTTATITSTKVLLFTPANYNVPQTLVITGKNDRSNQGTKANKLLAYPLLSNDASYHGVNPLDRDFAVYATLPTAKSGQAYSTQADYSSASAQFELQGAPVGMSINAKTGVITWQPDSSEVGSYDLRIIAKENGVMAYNKAVNLKVELAGANPTNAFYVVPNGMVTNPVGVQGSIGNPYTSIETALAAASLNPSKRTVYVRGGRYDNIAVQMNNIQGTEGNDIILTHLAGERVKFSFDGLSAFDINETASHITVDGFEIDGDSNNKRNDFTTILSKNWWDPKGDRTIGGGQGFDVDGQYITLRNNVIHDVYQKGVNIYKGRYVNVHDNVIYNIGHFSLSGGHGIMRKWERNFHINPTDKVDLGLDVYTNTYPYRFDFEGNLLLQVEQHIYSRVFNKGYSNLTIDEGKPIAIDETQDTDPKARISQNLVLYGGIDHIRLKQNPNVEVSNNSVITDLANPAKIDGITDASKLPNLKFYNNLVASKGIAIDVADSFLNTNGTDADPNQLRKYNNFVAGGGTITEGTKLSGITNKGTDINTLFNMASKRFYAMIAGTGVNNEQIDQLFKSMDDYAIEVKPSGWVHDHVRNTNLILSGIPKTVFDTSTYYLGQSSIEAGRKALFIKFIDSDGKWLYNKREIDGVAWNALQNKDLTDTTIYDLANVGIQKCVSCKGAYVFQLVLPPEWVAANANTTVITNSDGTQANLVRLDPTTNSEHRTILDYSAAGKVRSY